MSKSKQHLAIFASGTGSNAEKIIQYFKDNPSIEISLIVSNQPAALVLEKAKQDRIDTLVVEKAKFFDTKNYVEQFQALGIDWIILAGFLWLIPKSIIDAFPNKIINIHPALLPKYGGKGMYGMNVHRAVLENNEKESGITIHYVNEHYDEGQIIFQAECPIDEGDSPEKIQKKVQVLEHTHYPRVIGELIKKIANFNAIDGSG
jgi:phosphoribosylglycinamide formyltransferase 1